MGNHLSGPISAVDFTAYLIKEYGGESIQLWKKLRQLTFRFLICHLPITFVFQIWIFLRNSIVNLSVDLKIGVVATNFTLHFFKARLIFGERMAEIVHSDSLEKRFV